MFVRPNFFGVPLILPDEEFFCGQHLPVSDAVEIPKYKIETAQGWAMQIANRGEDSIELELPLSKANYYVELQREFARRYPIESDRPAVNLIFRNSKLPPQKTVGIIGGLGPLADAHLIELLQSQLSSNCKKSIEIRLCSNPHPPRDWGSAFHLSSWSYLFEIRKFLTQKRVDEFWIASNTAHIHYGFLNWLSNNRLFDAVSSVCKTLAQHQIPHERVVVLGTSSAYEHKLYPKAMKSHGLKVVMPSVEQQIEVQKAIDCLKAGDDDEGRKILISVIKALGNPPISHLVLACTELPLVLNSQVVRALLGYECAVVDTTDLFAMQIADCLKA